MKNYRQNARECYFDDRGSTTGGGEEKDQGAFVYNHMITSPLLLLAIAASLGACYILALKNAEKKIVVGGHKVSMAHQYAVIGVLSLPVFYIAGAGAALFWVLGIFKNFLKLRF
ncbi:Prenylated Rab acceptor protein 1 [Portunus trituberculatus]|uniref:PRA1 family protein n=1 Tax=Portunus trituberculatus TaxID=210409 RepID=A0A5B7JQC2_PORTR|nr:Prenylated Rab acceptor protein 1 [Portunus trituberculatus]